MFKSLRFIHIIINKCFHENPLYLAPAASLNYTASFLWSSAVLGSLDNEKKKRYPGKEKGITFEMLGYMSQREELTLYFYHSQAVYALCI